MNVAKTRVAFAVPETEEVHMYDIWGKASKELRRQTSFRDCIIR